MWRAEVPYQQEKSPSDEITVERSGVPLRIKSKQNKGDTQNKVCCVALLKL